MIHENILSTIGNTPLVRLNKIKQKYNLPGNIVAKLEFFNPLGSVKDRIALNMIEDAEQKNLITPGKTTLIEPTSGNTGIGLAFVAAYKGYELILTMPESMSLERRKMMRFLGAKIVLTPAEKGMKGAIEKAKELQEQTPNSYILRQFDNPSNPEIHRKTTAVEIWRDTDGQIDILVSGVGTGGTITGIGQVIKKLKPSFKAIAVEPTSSPVLSGGSPSPHKIQGIGAGFVPSILDTSIYDEIIQITNEEAFAYSKELAKTEGIPAGISSGAALGAAINVAARPENKDKLIVVIIPSFAERYLSTILFEGLD